MQGPNGVQNAHYALVRALADGTPQIDTALGRIGQAGTNDVVRARGHVYSNKAPGLALVVLPAFVVLDAVGAVSDTDPTRVLWALGLLGAVAPAVGLVLLCQWAGDRVAPGFGLAAGVTLAAGTLVLPFATLFLSHVLSAFFVFAAFTLLWRSRSRAESRLPFIGAGLLAGLAVVTEYPNVLAAAVLGAYAVAGVEKARRGVSFAAGALVGVLPLVAYNTWAFRSPFSVSYLSSQGPKEDYFDPPSAHVALELLFSFPGLLVLSPVLVCGVVGLVLMYRQGQRAEVLVAATLSALYLVYNAGFYSPFGGFSPGPRYLITVLPFLCFPLAASFRALPATTSALAVASVAIMALVTATHALAGYDGRWFDRIQSGETTLTAGSLGGVTGAVAISPFLVAVAGALGLALLATPIRSSPRDALLAGGAMLTWAFAAALAPGGSEVADFASYLPLFGVVGAFVALLVIAARLLERSVADARSTA
jgi:hypothetical protein